MRSAVATAAFLAASTLAPVAAAADLGVASPVIASPPATAGAVMFSPATTTFPPRYVQTYIIQQPAPGIDVYQYDDVQTAPSVIIVVPPGTPVSPVEIYP